MSKRRRECLYIGDATTPEEVLSNHLRGLPEVFVCPECGIAVRADEDGCCAGCGRDTEIMTWDEALRREQAR